MKLSTWKHLDHDKPGSVKMTPEDSDDIYSLYQLLDSGDLVESQTVRKVINENAGSGATDATRMRITLQIRAEKIEIDLSSNDQQSWNSSSSSCLRITGRVSKESQWVKMGAYHSLDIVPGTTVIVTKEQGWDSLCKQVLYQAGDPQNKAEVGAVVIMPSDGTCLIGLINASNLQTGNPSMSLSTSQPPLRILKKLVLNKKHFTCAPGSSSLEKAEQKLVEEIKQALLECFDLGRLKALLFASPLEHLREMVPKKLLEIAVREELRPLQECRQKIIKFSIGQESKKGGSSSTDIYASLGNLLQEPRIKAILETTKTAQEQKLLAQVYSLIKEDTADDSSLIRAVYGMDQVKSALELGAIRTLLVSNARAKSTDIAERRSIAKLIKDTKDQCGGQVIIFSPCTGTEAELNKITGVAAILSFPISLVF